MSRTISIAISLPSPCLYCASPASHLIGEKQTPCCSSSIYSCPEIRRRKQPIVQPNSDPSLVCSCFLPAKFLIGKDLLPCCQDMTNKCSARINSAREKNAKGESIQDRMIRVHGISNPSKLPSANSKRLKTYAQRYGTNNMLSLYAKDWGEKFEGGHPMRDPAIKEKRKRTYNIRYNADHPMLNPEVKARYRASFEAFLGDEARQNSWKENQKRTFLKRFGVPHPMKNSQVVAKRAQMWKEKYGGHPIQSVEVHKKWQASAFRQKLYTLPSGRVLKLRGFEAKVLEHLISNWGFAEEDFEFDVSNFPEIYYADPSSNRKCRYYPDFYLPQLKWIIEVKSEYTFLEVEKQVFERNLAKRSACLALGFDFSFLIWNPKLSIFIEF